MSDILTLNDKIGNYPASAYAADKRPNLRPQLQGTISADVVIIGGGLTGLSAARRLARGGKDVVLLEASRVGFGASGRNGGQIGTAQRIDQHSIEKMVGWDDAHGLFDIGVRAAKMVKHEAGDTYAKGFVHAATNERNMRREHEYARYLQDAYSYEDIDILDEVALNAYICSPKYHGGIIDHGAGHADPLALALKIASEAEDAGARIFEKSRAVSLGPATTEHGQVRAERCILALNGYHNDLDPLLSKYVMPINNFIVATEPLGTLGAEILPGGAAVADNKFVVNYFRLSPDGRLLFGGGESYGYRFPRNLADKVRRSMLAVFPSLHSIKGDDAWGGTLGITQTLILWRVSLIRCFQVGADCDTLF